MSENVSKDPPALSQPRVEAPGHGHSSEHFWVLALGSVGVVFGDIGTSPLYALQTALGQFKGTGLGPSDVIGVVSLIIWALLIIVTGKYVLFLMQADNKGEGGILSLKALAQRALGQAHDDRLPARRGGRGALFRRRHDHAGDLGPFRARGAEAGRLRSRALYSASDDGHSRLFSSPRRAAARPGVAAFFGPIMVVFFASTRRWASSRSRRPGRSSRPESRGGPQLHFRTRRRWVSSFSAASSSR